MSHSDCKCRIFTAYCSALCLRNSQEGGRAQKVRLEFHAVPAEAGSFSKARDGSQVEEVPEAFRLPLASTDVPS